ncbi:MAG: hypothetical protein RQ966_16860, partial [Acetobacteraceae bacterium]|nr:hypothetical protein [Acetobacteraceae bacterium]
LSADTYWLLQPRSKNAVKLSAILAYLLVKIPGPGQIDVMWTCCRSPIGHKGLWSANIHRPWDKYEITTKTEAAVADIISAPGEGKRTSEDKDFDEATWAVKHNCADGTVNLVNASNTSAMLNYASWPGFKGILTTGRMDFLMERKLPE